jgi:ankyrin repeat protein
MELHEILKPKTMAEIEEGLRKLTPNEKLRKCEANGYLEDVKEALFEGADINYKLENGDTPLDLATFGNQYNVCEYLLEHGAWVSDTSLGYSIRNGNLFSRMLRDLHPQLCNCKDLSEVIQIAADNGKLDLIKQIEEKIKVAGQLSDTDRNYLQKMMLEADDITYNNVKTRNHV